jgi:hypothetical protein
MKLFTVNNGRIRHGLEHLQTEKLYTYTERDFLVAGWTKHDFMWYKRAVPYMGEEAALTALCDGHCDLLVIGGRL